MAAEHTGAPDESGRADDAMIELVFDTETKQPACVLLQAAYGCPTYPVHWFDTRHWLVYPTPNMRRIRGTPAQFKTHAERMNQAEGGRA